MDVWALGALYYTLLTNTHAFNAQDIDHLHRRLANGDWIWPKDVMFSLQGLDFFAEDVLIRPEASSWLGLS